MTKIQVGDVVDFDVVPNDCDHYQGVIVKITPSEVHIRIGTRSETIVFDTWLRMEFGRWLPITSPWDREKQFLRAKPYTF